MHRSGSQPFFSPGRSTYRISAGTAVKMFSIGKNKCNLKLFYFVIPEVSRTLIFDWWLDKDFSQIL